IVKHRRKSERTPTPNRPLTIFNCDPMFGLDAAAGNGFDVQQLVRQISPGNALVARSTFHPVEPLTDARKKPRLVYEDFVVSPRTSATAGLRWCALAEDDIAGRPRQPVADRAVADLAAAASDLLCRARLSESPEGRNARKIQNDCRRNRRFYGSLRPF